MNKRVVVVALLVMLGMPAAAKAQTEPMDEQQPAGEEKAMGQEKLTAEEVEIRLEKPVVITAARRNAGDPGSSYLRNYLRFYAVVPQAELSLKSRDAVMYAAGFGGLDRYEPSRAELTFQGLGMGASLGLCAGAFGSSFGLWNDDKALLIMGAMSAFGAIRSASKADEPGVSFQLRLREDP